MKDKYYYIEMFIEWADKWMPICIDMTCKPKGYATKREAILGIDKEARKFKGYHKYRVVKAGKAVAYKGVCI